MELTPNIIQKFRENIRSSENGCIVWTGATLSNGYGYVTYKNKMFQVTRISYYLSGKEIPKKLHHLCGNKQCVNPDHLVPSETTRCGDKFNMLRAINYHSNQGQSKLWLFVCDCGKETVAKLSHVKEGRIKSCGCFKSKVSAERAAENRTHGMTATRFYHTWEGMKNRCHNPKHTSYRSYGAKGIAVSKEWQSFEKFKSDMYEKYLLHAELHGEKDTYIDRIDPKKGYSLENCAWVTMAEQHNNKTTNVFITYQGETDTISNMCRKYKLPYSTVQNRLKRGWSAERAFTQPILVKKKRAAK